MAFGKAPRFVEDIQGLDVPAPGTYNPKFETDLANSSKKGMSLYKSGRFQPEKCDDNVDDDATFAQPNSLPCQRKLYLTKSQSSSTASLNRSARGRGAGKSKEDKLTAEINELHTAYVGMAKQCERLNTQLHEAQTARDESQAITNEQKSANENLERKIIKLTELNNELTEQNANMINEIKSTHLKLSHSEKKIMELEVAIQSMESKNTELTEKNNKLDTANLVMAKKCDHLNSQLREAQAALAESQLIINEQKVANESLESKNIKLTEENANMNNEIKSTHLKLSRSEKKIMELEVAIQSIESKNTELTEKNNKLDNANIVMARECDLLNSQLREGQAALEESKLIINEHKLTIESLESENTELTEKNNKLDTANIAMAKECDHLNSQLREGQAALEESKLMINEHKLTIEGLESRNIELTDKNNKLDTANIAMAKECDLLNCQVREGQAAIEESKLMINEQKLTIESLESENIKLTEGNANMINEIKSTCLKLSHSEKKTLELQQSLATQREEQGRKAEEFQTMGRKYLGSIENIRAKLVSASEVHGKWADTKKENSDLVKRLKSLEVLVDLKSNQNKQLENELVEERNGRMETEAKLKETQEKYADALGHTNAKQKIHHLQNLKRELAAAEEEKVRLQRENLKLQGQLSDAQRLAFKY